MSTAVDADGRLQDLEQLVPHPGLPTPPEVVKEIGSHSDDYLADLDAFANEGRIDSALRVAVRLAPYWYARGLIAEGRARLAALLDGEGEVAPAVHAQALELMGTMAFEQGDDKEARVRFRESLAEARRARDAIAEAAAEAGLARCDLVAGDLDSARTHARASEKILRKHADERALDRPLHILAYADYVAGDDDLARAGFEGTLALNRRLGDRRAVGRELTNLCSVETRAGNLDRAQTLGEEALRIAVEIDNRSLVMYSVINLAGVASATGDHQRAARLLGAGEAMMAQLGVTLNPGTAIEYRRHVQRSRAALGHAAYAAAVLAGRDLGREAAIELALRS